MPGIVDPLVGPEAPDRDDPAVKLADRARVVPGDVRGLGAGLPVAVSSITGTPPSCGVVAGSATSSSNRRWLIASPSQGDSERKSWSRWTEGACAPTTGTRR
jgi:hypothetical protein